MSVAEWWKRLRRDLSHRVHLSRSQEVGLMARWLGVRRGDVLLDVGCGDGYWTSRLVDRASYAIGIDLDPDAIDRAQRFYCTPRLGFVLASAESLPFARHSFTKIVSVCAIHHFKDDEAAFREFARVLRRDGLLSLTADSFTSPWLTDGYRKRHARMFQVTTFYDLPTLSKRLERNGFQVQKHRWVLRSRVTSELALLQNRLGLSVNWLFPISLPIAHVSEWIFNRIDAGHILAVLAKRV